MVLSNNEYQRCWKGRLLQTKLDEKSADYSIEDHIGRKYHVRGGGRCQTFPNIVAEQFCGEQNHFSVLSGSMNVTAPESGLAGVTLKPLIKLGERRISRSTFTLKFCDLISPLSNRQGVLSKNSYEGFTKGVQVTELEVEPPKTLDNSLHQGREPPSEPRNSVVMNGFTIDNVELGNMNSPITECTMQSSGACYMHEGWQKTVWTGDICISITFGAPSVVASSTFESSSGINSEGTSTVHVPIAGGSSMIGNSEQCPECLSRGKGIFSLLRKVKVRDSVGTIHEIRP